MEQESMDIINRLRAGTMLERWDIRFQSRYIPDGETTAETIFHEDVMRAAITLNLARPESECYTVTEILAHELGHIVTDSLIDLIPGDESVQRNAVKERLATRVGLLLMRGTVRPNYPVLPDS